MLSVLCIGDIVGEAGRIALSRLLPAYKARYQPTLVIANGENASGGIGIIPKNAEDLFALGIDVLTTGNHIWKHKEIRPYIAQKRTLIRPMNYGDAAPGSGFVFIEKGNIRFLVINMAGQVYMEPLYPPFSAFNEFYNRNFSLFQEADCVILDFHAEATSEKAAFAHFVKDRVNLVYGTHTHVQTADERLLSPKTAFISDVGMTGPYDSIIGMQTDIIVEKFSSLLPKAYRVAEGRGMVNAVLLEFDEHKKLVTSLKRINDLVG